ncbi:MAG: P-loop NTPase [Planctomycetaceae bacterium]
MRDQASTLRNLIQRRSADAPSSAGERARIVTFTSGKGGVGKSNLALNVAVAMAQAGARVCLLDANPGLSNIDLLCGLNCYWNFGHVLTGAKSLSEVILKGPAGINILPGASGLLELAATQNLSEEIASLETAYDVLIVDAATGLTETARRFAQVADITFLITTPEPTAVADAYATLKAWQGSVTAMPEVLVNRANSAAEAKQILERFRQTVEMFLRCPPPSGGWIAEDAAVAQAVAARRPFVETAPEGAATRDVRAIAKRLLAAAKPTRQQSLPSRI